MTFEQLLPYLLGPFALTVGSLLLNYLQAKGVILSRNVVPKDQYERVVASNEAYAGKFGEQTDAMKVLASGQAVLAERIGSKGVA